MGLSSTGDKHNLLMGAAVGGLANNKKSCRRYSSIPKSFVRANPTSLKKFCNVFETTEFR